MVAVAGPFEWRVIDRSSSRRLRRTACAGRSGLCCGMDMHFSCTIYCTWWWYDRSGRIKGQLDRDLCCGKQWQWMHIFFMRLVMIRYELSGANNGYGLVQVWGSDDGLNYQFSAEVQVWCEAFLKVLPSSSTFCLVVVLIFWWFGFLIRFGSNWTGMHFRYSGCSLVIDLDSSFAVKTPTELCIYVCVLELSISKNFLHPLGFWLDVHLVQRILHINTSSIPKCFMFKFIVLYSTKNPYI